MSPTVFIQVPKGHTKSKWLLWIARNWGGVQIVGEFDFLKRENGGVFYYTIFGEDVVESFSYHLRIPIDML